jgi:hypothetical protein
LLTRVAGAANRDTRRADMIVVVYPSERRYLRQLRILGAWWCLGSSALTPRVLLLEPPATF